MVGAERRARLVECERAQPVAPEEAVLAASPSRPSFACRHYPRHSSFTTSSQDEQQAKRDGRRACNGRNPQIARFSWASPQIGPNARRFRPPCGKATPHLWAVFGLQPGKVCGCRPSSPASPATSAPPSCRALRATATTCAASPARASASRRAGAQLDELVLGDALDRRRARRGAGRRRGRLLPDPLDGGRGGGAFAEHGARAAPSASPPPRRRPACGGSSTSAGSCRATAPPSRHLASRLAVEEALLDGRAGVDRAARLDRDRRPLALVPLPRAADRAAARAGAARLARQPHRARSTAATCSSSCAARRDRAGRARRPLVGHRRPGRR